MVASSSAISRRTMIGGAVAGAGSLALAGCATDENDATGLHMFRVGRTPDDPNADVWGLAQPFEIDLGPQDMALPMRLDPAVTTVRVRALHDGTTMGFLMEWTDEDTNDLSVRVDEYRDACAVMIAEGTPGDAARTMGGADLPVNLLHWKADWQRDVDQGRQGLDAAYPNRAVDVYPPLFDVAPADVDIDAYVEHGATNWLPGVHAGNPISVGSRTSPVEKLVAFGFSTTTHLPTQNAGGGGVRTSTGWKVCLTRPLAAVDERELPVLPGASFTSAFTVWSGGGRDVGSRKAPSRTVHVVTVAP